MRAATRLLPFLAVLTLAACGGDGGGWQMPPTPVHVAPAAAQDVAVSFEYAGRTAGSREVQVRSRVSGTLVERTYTEGAFVKQGALLFVIDPGVYRAEANAAIARLEQARLNSAGADREASRILALHEQKLVSDRDRDAALLQQRSYAQGLRAAEAEAERAAIQLGYTRVTAPVSGVTSLEVRTEGSLVGPAQGDSLLTTITQLDPLRVNFSIPEEEMGQLRALAKSGRLVLPADGRYRAIISTGDGVVLPQEGVVDFVDLVIDPDTGSLRARATVSNTERTLLPGQFVRVRISGATLKNAFVLPETAIQQGPQGSFVYLAGDDNKAAVLPVTVGFRVEGGRVVEGLKGGEPVILDNFVKLYPGAAIQRAAPADAPAAATPPAAPAAAKKS